ncbi:MAG TPA: MBL fold metallo-hydrolase [Rhodospirillales bacterium]|nr:MBL fold metallo-hydrolase [Rhodospirillales bacterium]
MKICIHRGTKQIGGTCIEVEAQGKRIVLDVGLPLDADETEDINSLLPEVAGFNEQDDSLLGVVISHPHQDHYGLGKFIRPDLSVYIGERADAILKAASNYVPNATYFENATHYEAWKPMDVGPFRITPYLVDHSAFDAYSFLIEADGKRVFYSGDFRGHGRKARLFDNILQNPPKDIDVLMMEGTTISRTGTEKGFQSEGDLEKAFIKDMGDTSGIYLVHASAQNIDRVVTIYRAAKQSGRHLIIDLYAAVILEAADEDRLPQSSWENVNLFTPHAQRIHIKKNKLFADLDRHKINRIYPEDLARDPARYVMLMRPWMREDLDRAACVEGARFAYSMWSGYLEEDYLKDFQAWLDERGIPMNLIHTSGHASVKDLEDFAKAMSPEKLVPIHSFETERFGDYFKNVENKDDGIWWGV